MSSSDERGVDRPRPPSVDRVPTLTEVVELAPWDEPVAAPSAALEAPIQQVDAAAFDADDASPFEATVVLPPCSVTREPAADVPLDLSNELPDLAGLSLDSGAAWHRDADLPPQPVHGQPSDAVVAAPWQDDRVVPAPSPDPAALVAQVLDELAPRIDLIFEVQLRDALAPVLQRVADALVQDAREQLSATLRGLVEQAVARTLQEHGDR